MARDGEWKTFDSKSFQERAEVMYLYLVEGHNMEVTADIYYRNNNPQYSKHVSLITRCYNFSGRNKGVFSGNRFGDLVTKDDILAFVKEYPDGIESESSMIAGFSPTALPIIFGTRNISCITCTTINTTNTHINNHQNGSPVCADCNIVSIMAGTNPIVCK